MKKTITISEFEKELTPVLKPEDLRTLAENYRQQMSMEDALDLFGAISTEFTAASEKDPQRAKALEEMSLLDKLLNIVIESYVVGAVHASEVTAEAMTKQAVKILEEYQVA